MKHFLATYIEHNETKCQSFTEVSRVALLNKMYDHRCVILNLIELTDEEGEEYLKHTTN